MAKGHGDRDVYTLGGITVTQLERMAFGLPCLAASQGGAGPPQRKGHPAAACEPLALPGERSREPGANGVSGEAALRAAARMGGKPGANSSFHCRGGADGGR